MLSAFCHTEHSALRLICRYAAAFLAAMGMVGALSAAWAQTSPTVVATPSAAEQGGAPTRASGEKQVQSPQASPSPASAATASVLNLPPVTVHAASSTTYNVTEATAGTKTDTPIMDTPLSVTVIPQQVLEDQQTTFVPDALQNVSGVIPSDDSFGTGDSFSIRGFNQNELTYEDGLRTDEYTTSEFPVDLANVDQIQVVKGPAAVLYGQAEPGGLVSIVTKKPLDTPHYSLAQQVGGWDFYRTTADATGPLTSNGKLLYRFNLDYEDAGSFRNFIYNHRLALFPTLEWRPTADNHIIVELSYDTGTQVLDPGIPFLPNGQPAAVSISANYLQPKANRLPESDYAVKVLASHKFNQSWQMNVAYKSEYNDTGASNNQYYAGNAAYNGDLPRVGFTDNYSNQWTDQVVADLVGKLDLHVVRDTILTGFDLYYQHGHYDSNFYDLPTINIYHPNYNLPYNLPKPSTDFYVSNGQTAWGWYFQNQIELPEKLYLLGGFRFDDVSTFDNGYSQGGSVNDGPQVTPRVGLLWRPIRQLSFYTSYTENYGATGLGSLTPNGQPLPPQSAQQYEVGLKLEDSDQRLSATTSIYQLTKENIPTTDPANPAYTIAVGQEQSRGYELEVTGSILPHWKIIGGYSYIACFVTQDNSTPSLIGTRCQAIPYNSGSLWTTYEMKGGFLRGLKFGAGLTSRSAEVAYGYRATANNTPYLATDRVPGFATVNAMASYEWHVGFAKMTAQLNIENLLDQKYFSGVNVDAAAPGSPLNALGQIRMEL